MAAKPKQGSAGKKGKDSSKDAGAEQSAQNRLPFEPGQNRKKSPKKEKTAPAPIAPTQDSPADRGKRANSPSSAAIPEAVNRRMVRRVAFFSGIPTSLGMLTFVISYFIVKNQLFKLPTVVVLLVSMGCFGLGVLGLSYGALSASWDEDRLGSWHGWGEFAANFARLRESWREMRQKSQ